MTEKVTASVLHSALMDRFQDEMGVNNGVTG